MTTHRSAAILRGLVVALVAVTACETARAAADPPVASERFAPGWQERARPLFREGPGVSPATNSWLVSPLLPRGRYVLVDRRGDGAELIPGYRLEIDGEAFREIHMMLPSSYGDVQALPAADVPAR